MSLPELKPYQNGQTPASSETDGAFISTAQLASPESPHDTQLDLNDLASPAGNIGQQTRTTFPSDSPNMSMRTILYGIVNHYFGGITLFRWLNLLFVGVILVAIIAATAYWVTGLSVILLVVAGMWLLRRVYQHHDYIRFYPKDVPFADQGDRLSPSAKVPVHVTGLFAVEERNARFTWLPGFYRSFATREHALLCQHPETHFLKIAGCEPDNIGMWYVFFQPDEVKAIRWGEIMFGSTPRHCIAVDRMVEKKAKSRFRRDKITAESTYIAVTSIADGQRIWDDLRSDLSIR